MKVLSSDWKGRGIMFQILEIVWNALIVSKLHHCLAELTEAVNAMAVENEKQERKEEE